MELMRVWVLRVTVCAMVLAVAEAVMPDGTVKKVGKLTGGLLLTLVLLQPLLSLDEGDLQTLADSVQTSGFSQEALAEQAAAPMKGLIEEELGAYIEEKGTALGLTCTAQVECVTGEGGVPVPSRVTVTGSWTQAQQQTLSQVITQDLGLQREAQIYRKEGTP